MTEYVESELSLWDPERDLLALPGAPGASHPLGERVLSAFEEVRYRVVAERLLKVGKPSSGRSRDPFPAMPAVTVLNPSAEPVLRQRVRTVVECLERLVQRYPGDAELQDFLDVPPVLNRWILQQAEPERLRVDFCRLDLLGESLGSVRVLEFNPSSPGGVISAGMIHRFWRESSFGDLLAQWGVPEAPMERPEWFADWLIAYGREHGVREEDARRVGVFRSHWSTQFELDQVCAQLLRRGRTPVELEPDDTEGAKALRLGYLKYIPVDPAEVGHWETFCSRLVDGDLVVPNALGERWVAENKLCLAALSDPRFRRLFTPRQCAALDALVPYSRKLGDGLREEEAVTDRERLVMKAPYSCRGESVVIGADTPADTWAGLVRDPAHRGWLLQERVVASEVETQDGTYFRDLVVPVLAGRVIGYASRMNQGHLLNGSRGGGDPAVFAPHELCDATPCPPAAVPIGRV
ncbi:hypothetical protein [Streptomyces olivoreticuli]|uniref:hypothetical protein n=1 Tax=Streptomyces olivoreticuli TaxID=68246 RepID=UPI000E22937A|nr:hypothetical protein [Streptomyces olivoreticuli]